MKARASDHPSPKTGERYVRLINDAGEDERHLTKHEAPALLADLTQAVDLIYRSGS